MTQFMRRLLFVLLFVLTACSTLTPAAPTPEETGPQSLFAIFTDGQVAVWAQEATFSWSPEGLNVHGETEDEYLFKGADVICATPLNEKAGVTTGAPDCRTAELVAPHAGEVIVDSPKEMFEAMKLLVATREELAAGTKDKGFLAIFSDEQGAPISNVSVRSAFLMLNRNNGTIISDRGIFQDFPSNAKSVCIYLNDTVNPFGLRECMPIGGE